ncbi:MAG: MATE family efflux transporter [Rectinemataceae bacterium]
MTLKPLHKTVLIIAGPAAVELILTSLTSLADTIMVGKLGAYAISAVGLTNQPRFIMLAVFIALNVGATALVARFKGQGNNAEAEIVTAQAVLLTTGMAALLTVPGILFAREMVLFMGAQPDTVEAATAYFRILMIGFVPTAIPLAITALLRGVGETRISMRYNITANVVNIIFNYLLIYGKFGFPRLEVRGAAIATVIGNCAACAMALYTAFGGRAKSDPGRASNRASNFIRLRFRADTLRPNFPMLKRIIRIGFPSAAEQFALRVGLLMFTVTVTSLGTAVFAAHQIVLSVLNLSFVNGQAFGIAATSLTGQALGRGEPESAITSSAACRKIGSLISTSMGVLMLVFRYQLMGLFTVDPEIIALGAKVMIFAACVQPFQSSFQIYAGALRGAGDSLYPAISLAAGILIVRPLLSYLGVSVLGLGLIGAWLALFLDQTVRFFLIRVRFASGKWVHARV